MNRLRSLKRQMFDIRPGEHLRTWAMFSYLLSVLFAYYILKPVSRAMFLTKFNFDDLPQLYILIALFGGVFAYLYSKLAAKVSLGAAVLATMSLSVAALIAMWAFIHFSWMIYVLNIFVSLFSIVLVSQGWLVASNLFDAREAKRLYPLLGMGMVIGAAFGGEFTNRTAMLVGTRNLLIASAVMVVVAYVCFRIATSQKARVVKDARGAHEEETDFSFGGMMRDIGRTKHLQVIVGIMVAMYLVDTLVEYQFQVSAAGAYKGDRLTAFFGQFYGLYLNLTEFVFQLFVTATIVRRWGVGGTLQVAPACILLSSIATAVAPSVQASGAVRLTEASTRYTLNRTGMELLYMPLPQELRNRIKAFIDICVDRLSRGLAGVLLVLLTKTSLHLGIKGISVVVMALCIPWMYFSWLARREYVATIRKRFEARRLDFENARVSVQDAATIRFLEGVVAGDNPRQAAYALTLLVDAPGYDARPIVTRAAGSPHADVRETAYRLAAAQHFEGLPLDGRHTPATIQYAIAISPERDRVVREFLADRDPGIVSAALETLRDDKDRARALITSEWLDGLRRSSDPRCRALAAAAIGIRGEESEDLRPLFDDADPQVAAAAVQAAGESKSRAYIFPLIHALGNPRLRGEAIDALAGFGPQIAGTLSDVLLDEGLDIRVRRQVPRVLKKIPNQRSVDVLLAAVSHQDLSIRAAVLKALNRLRETDPKLNFDKHFVTEQISAEARHYYELNAALEPFKDRKQNGRTAARMLALTIEERLKGTLDRLFRLLGLQYPPKEMYSAYRAVSRRQHEEATAALEFLDSTLERDLKRILLPLLDAPEHLHEHGRELFGVGERTAEDAIRELIRSHDPWLVACAMAAAAELGMRNLAPDIHQAAEESRDEVVEVARSAEARLAA